MPERKVYFSDRDLKALAEGKRAAADALELIGKAERCGVDCDARRQQLEALQEALANMERDFAPVPTS